ncbi:MAG TPA: hypothetical protein VFT22_00270 [Kofleriaceae bacterium]|nr:hypothetical protein [Kofleriaceae bacterium]
MRNCRRDSAEAGVARVTEGWPTFATRTSHPDRPSAASRPTRRRASIAIRATKVSPASAIHGRDTQPSTLASSGARSRLAVVTGIERNIAHSPIVAIACQRRDSCAGRMSRSHR